MSDPKTEQGTPAEHQEAEAAAAEPEAATAAPTDADGDPVKGFYVSGDFLAEDLHDAYKLLQAHFLALSRGEASTLGDVSCVLA